MQKFTVVADIFYGGREIVKTFDDKEAAQTHADSLFNHLDIYTAFSVIESDEAI